jgi:DNA-binding PadR family transcriptional regulator
MTKREILEFFARSNRFITPDQVWQELRRTLDRRSVYSYLLRLKRQGLLESGPYRRRGDLVYRITDRGHARLQYFRSHLPKA